MAIELSNPESAQQQQQPTPEELREQSEREKEMKRTMTIITIVAVVILVALIAGITYLLLPSTSGEWVGKLRDVFIIVVALESFIIGAALVVLVVQLASLINLLQNEVRPILKATTDTVNNLRGTAEFLGENVVEPVIKLNSYLAGLYRMLELMGIKKK
jgi:amino acid permease